MENWFFWLIELVITGNLIPVKVADKLIRYHIIPMNKARKKLGEAIWPSQKSGYRPIKWEKRRGRTGLSQHCFGEGSDKYGIPENKDCKGAVDWTCKGDLNKLLEVIISETEYTRISVYYDKHFIHCDYKNAPSDRSIYHYDKITKKWKLHKRIPLAA